MTHSFHVHDHRLCSHTSSFASRAAHFRRPVLVCRFITCDVNGGRHQSISSTTTMGIQDTWLSLCPGHDIYAEPKVGLEAQYLPALSSVVGVRVSPTLVAHFCRQSFLPYRLPAIASRSTSTPLTNKLEVYDHFIVVPCLRLLLPIHRRRTPSFFIFRCSLQEQQQTIKQHGSQSTGLTFEAPISVQRTPDVSFHHYFIQLLCFYFVSSVHAFRYLFGQGCGRLINACFYDPLIIRFHALPVTTFAHRLLHRHR